MVSCPGKSVDTIQIIYTGTFKEGLEAHTYEVPIPQVAAPRPSRFHRRDIVEPYHMETFRGKSHNINFNCSILYEYYMIDSFELPKFDILLFEHKLNPVFTIVH